MDPTYISALAGLAGATIGGLTSFGSTWLTRKAELKAQRREMSRRQRERLFVDFMNEASRLYADALGHEKDDITDLVGLYAIVAHLRMVSSPEIVAAAERVVVAIVEAYQAPNHTLQEVRELVANGHIEVFRELGTAFQAELARFGNPLALPERDFGRDRQGATVGR